MATTIQVPLSEELTRFVEAQAEFGEYGDPSEYVRELILDARDRRRELEEHLEEALKGQPVAISDEEWQHGDILALGLQRLRARG